MVLEDLADEFNLHAQEAIDRVQELEKMGRITGVSDDRGKFIYIEPAEMEKVRPVTGDSDDQGAGCSRSVAHASGRHGERLIGRNH